jgi:hypothetical protein
MPVLTTMEQIPERIWVDFLRACLIPPEEIPVIVPLERSLFMFSIPNVGFLVTAKRLVIYEKKFMHGLIKHDEVLLPKLNYCSYSAYEQGQEFHFGFANGKEYWVKISVNASEAALIEKTLLELDTGIAAEINLF